MVRSEELSLTLLADLRTIVHAALDACDAAALLKRALDTHPLPPDCIFNVIAAGKAAQPMADAFMLRYASRAREVLIARGGHPLPDAESFASGARALALADANRARGEIVVLLLSGGASAMLAAPAEDVTREQKIEATRELLRSGKPIAEINAVRKQLSAIKGGKLADRAGRCITYALSDVHAPVEDDPTVIGSGPGVRDLTPKSRDFVLVGSRRDAMEGARLAAERLGYALEVVATPVLGEACEAAMSFAAHAARVARKATHAVCIIASGETTVKLRDSDRGRGGRSQEFALAAAMELDGLTAYALASFGTDGIDGPTDAAGAIVDATTLSRARNKGLDAARALQAHDTYPFFAALEDHIVTGPTGTNVGDVVIFISAHDG